MRHSLPNLKMEADCDTQAPWGAIIPDCYQRLHVNDGDASDKENESTLETNEKSRFPIIQRQRRVMTDASSSSVHSQCRNEEWWHTVRYKTPRTHLHYYDSIFQQEEF